MQAVFGALFFICFIMLVVSIINPKWGTFKQLTWTRKKAVGIWFLAGMICLAGIGVTGPAPEKQTTQQETQNAATQAKHTSIVTAPADSPEGKIQQAIADAFKASKVATGTVTLDHIDINLMDETHYNVNVWANYSDAPTTGLAVKAMKLAAIQAFAGAYKSGQPVGRVAFIVNGSLVNKNSGEERTAKIFQLELRSDKAGGFDWSNPDSINPDDLGKPWIHQAYRK